MKKENNEQAKHWRCLTTLTYGSCESSGIAEKRCTGAGIGGRVSSCNRPRRGACPQPTSGVPSFVAMGKRLPFLPPTIRRRPSPLPCRPSLLFPFPSLPSSFDAPRVGPPRLAGFRRREPLSVPPGGATDLVRSPGDPTRLGVVPLAASRRFRPGHPAAPGPSCPASTPSSPDAHVSATGMPRPRASRAGAGRTRLVPCWWGSVVSLGASSHPTS